ncbi:Zn-dependent exopeptidase M28, partial [Sulfolobus sp. E1]
MSDEGEIIAGSKEEEKIKNKIRKILELVSDEIRVTPVRVLNWREKEIIVECEGNKIDAISFPYSLSTDTEGNVSDNFSECNDKILKVNITSLFEVNKYYINAVKANCKAVIFSLDNENRRFVIKYGNMLDYGPCPPPPIPAIYVKSSDFNKIRGKCRIIIESEINPYATGYVIEGITNARNENTVVHITSHHDHWLAGERDDLLAVSLLPEFRSNLYETHLISYTAEESGSIYFSTFSWSYGSRTFLSNLGSEDLDNILININLDNISEYEIIIKTVPGLKDLFSGLYTTNIIDVPEIYTDSYSYIRNGIPSIDIGSKNNPHYHGEFDKIDPNDSKIIGNINLIKNIISKIINNNIYYNFNDMIEQVKNSMLYA